MIQQDSKEYLQKQVESKNKQIDDLNKKLKEADEIRAENKKAYALQYNELEGHKDEVYSLNKDLKNLQNKNSELDKKNKDLEEKLKNQMSNKKILELKLKEMSEQITKLETENKKLKSGKKDEEKKDNQLKKENDYLNKYIEEKFKQEWENLDKLFKECDVECKIEPEHVTSYANLIVEKLKLQEEVHLFKEYTLQLANLLKRTDTQKFYEKYLDDAMSNIPGVDKESDYYEETKKKFMKVIAVVNKKELEKIKETYKDEDFEI